jgi:hypothetical protein
MTIGIAAWGPDAGHAVFEALKVAERAARGSIGGFAVFVAITGDGRVIRAETQRGGTATLFLNGETTGTNPPDDAGASPLAALMSSGPDRPEPLAQFVVADGRAGLVTGHRLPNAAAVSGRPLNAEILDLMRVGAAPADAVRQVLEANPHADAGVIAASAGGDICARNSPRVSRRPDLGSARRVHRAPDGAATAIIEVMHNALFPAASLAPLVADIGLERMVPSICTQGWVTVRAGTPVFAADEDAVEVEDDMVVSHVLTSDHRIVTGRWNCAAIYLGSAVRQASRSLGHTLVEPNVIVEDGIILSLSGQKEMRLGYLKPPQGI